MGGSLSDSPSKFYKKSEIKGIQRKGIDNGQGRFSLCSFVRKKPFGVVVVCLSLRVRVIKKLTLIEQGSCEMGTSF